jgi:hypothetical protein
MKTETDIPHPISSTTAAFVPKPLVSQPDLLLLRLVGSVGKLIQLISSGTLLVIECRQEADGFEYSNEAIKATGVIFCIEEIGEMSREWAN